MSEYKQINGHPGYLVSGSGSVYSTATNWRGYGQREMSQSPNTHGYMTVRVRIGKGERKRLFVHKLVIAAFCRPRPSPAHEARHLDGDRCNNNWWNLEWGTKKDNAADRERHGRTSRGESHSRAVKRGLALSRRVAQ